MNPATPVPMLWVFPRDIIEGIHPEFLASLLGQLDGVKTWEFDGGNVAFSLPDVLVKHSIPVDYDDYLKKTRPVFKFIDPYLVPDHGALDLEIPDCKYCARISLKPREKDSRSCRYFKSQLKDWTPFGFTAYSSYELTKAELASVKKYLTDWITAASKKAVHGETLSLGNVELIDHLSLATERSYHEAGYEVRCSSYTPCTWPWIDFYLKMRRELPVKKRLSIRFFNP